MGLTVSKATFSCPSPGPGRWAEWGSIVLYVGGGSLASVFMCRSSTDCAIWRSKQALAAAVYEDAKRAARGRIVTNAMGRGEGEGVLMEREARERKSERQVER